MRVQKTERKVNVCGGLSPIFVSDFVYFRCGQSHHPNRLNHRVIDLDLILALVFGTLSAVSFGVAIFCFRKALKVSGARDGDLKMFLWATGTMFGLIVSGMSAAYILIPIFFHG